MDSTEKPTRWSLTDLLAEPIEQMLAETYGKLEQAITGLEALRGLLGVEMSASDFQKLLAGVESVNLLTSRLEAYTDLWLTEDTQNAAALNLRDQITEVITDANNRMLFFEIWFKDLPDDVANRLIAHGGGLRYFLEAMRQLKPFTLSEPEERMRKRASL